MPNGSPPPTFPVFNAGEQFSAHKRGYQGVLQAQDEVVVLQRRVHHILFEAKEKIEQVRVDPEIPEETKREVEKLWENAIALRDKADALVVRVGYLRLSMLRDAVDEIGRTLQQLKAWRSEIILGEAGLASMDADIAGLEARYRQIYRPMFPLTKLPGAVAEIPNPATWTEQDWDRITTHLDGPIFMWDGQRCRAEFPKIAPGVPACEGPDYLAMLMLVNQIFVAKENQIDIMREFPIISFFDMTFMGGELEEYEDEVRAAENALKAAKESGEDLLATLAALLKGIRKAAETFAKAPVLLIAGGLLALTLLRKKR